MKCVVCGKSSEFIRIHEGIMEKEIIYVCEPCAESEGIPLIRKPSEEQLKKAETRQSVRERMERLSGMGERSQISPEQMIVQRNLSKLRAPEKKEINDEVLDNYDWNVKIERRRRKMTPSQLANFSGVDVEEILSIEAGRLPNNFKEIFLSLENSLGIKLLRHHESAVSVRTKEDEEKILEEVRQKMGMKPKKREEIDEEKQEKIERINRGEFDFSRRNDLTNVTLNDLIDMKRERERMQKRRKEEEIESTMVGDELDLDDV